jgi:hypothetical protein
MFLMVYLPQISMPCIVEMLILRWAGGACADNDDIVATAVDAADAVEGDAPQALVRFGRGEAGLAKASDFDVDLGCLFFA